MPIRIGRSRLPELLAQSGLSQAEFARRMGITQPYVWQLIKGERFFSYTRAKVASDILNCSMEELYEWDYISGKR